MGEVFLGEEVVTDGPREFSIVASGYTDVARIDLLRNGEVVFATDSLPDLPQGWLTVPLRLEWGASDETTTWDGVLRVSGGQVVQTPFWSPDVTVVNDTEVAWVHSTKSFGELYGSQRGGIELSVVGPPEAVVTVTLSGRHLDVTLGELAADPYRVLPGSPGTFRLQAGIGGLSSLGSSRVEVSWTDDCRAPAFYYARAFLVDGEMAWASPIWVSPTGSYV
jgi:hypothetical protein